jgi:2-oxoglutarate dehydrogenase E2 component (dihydrolipoamide succinyltransferase)
MRLLAQEKMSRMRRTIASRLKQSQNTCASLTTIQEVDMTNLMAWRAKYKEEVAEKYGVRLGYMGAFTKATTLAALEIPQINAAIDTDKEITTWRDYVDISIAVSAPKGLVTPVLRNTHTLSIVELEREVAALAKKVSIWMDTRIMNTLTVSRPAMESSLWRISKAVTTPSATPVSLAPCLELPSSTIPSPPSLT